MSGVLKIKRLSDVAALLKQPLLGSDRGFHGVSSDSRTVQEGALFVALQGPNFDGSRFLDMAQQRGAVGAIVQQRRPIDLPQIVVEDALQALGVLAQAWRAQFELPLLAITGSNGKTTVKEMAASILRQLGPGTVTQGNLNNEIGVPLTLLRISEKDRWAIVEMGASAVGEIAHLSRMAQPTIALVNNAGAAHLGGFGSRQQIVEAKGELYAELDAAGCALINRDLPQAPRWRALAGASTIVEYGSAKSACSPDQLQATVSLDSPFTLQLKRQQIEIALPLPGAHNRLNALAAAALALQAGADLQQVQQGLEQMPPVPGRLQFKSGAMGSRLIDDTYNASPESMRSAIAVLQGCTGRRVLVLGDMGEMGDDAAAQHRSVGQAAREAGIEQLLVLGEQAIAYVSGFGGGAEHFNTLQALLERLKLLLNSDTTVLVKGSRFMKMERVVDALLVSDEGSEREMQR